MSWSARQYLAFEDERTRPARDLLAAVPPIQARRVVDIGCGPGNSTELLAARFPDAIVTALDSSPDMIQAARARLIAVDGPWARKLAAAASKRTRMASADWYYGILRASCGRVDVWRTIYHHPLAGGAAAVVEWFKGSGLRPFLEPLNEQERAAYLERYTAVIRDAYPALADGTVLLPFPRLFIVATR